MNWPPPNSATYASPSGSWILGNPEKDSNLSVQGNARMIEPDTTASHQKRKPT